MNTTTKGFRSIQRKKNTKEKRLLILSEAARAFIERGVTGTSLDSIADRLNITKPALYYYVKNKDEIISGCLDYATDRHFEFLANLDNAQVSGLEKLHQWMLHFGRSANDDFGKCIVLFDLKSLSTEAQKKHLELRARLVQATHNLIKEGIRDNSIGKCDPIALGSALIGAFSSTAHWLKTSSQASIDEFNERMFDIFLNGIASKKKK